MAKLQLLRAGPKGKEQSVSKHTSGSVSDSGEVTDELGFDCL